MFFKKKSDTDYGSYTIGEIKTLFTKLNELYHKNYDIFYNEFCRLYGIDEKNKFILKFSISSVSKISIIIASTNKKEYLEMSEVGIINESALTKNFFSGAIEDAKKAYNNLLVISNFFGIYRFKDSNENTYIIEVEPMRYSYGVLYYGSSQRAFRAEVMTHDLSGINESFFMNAYPKIDNLLALYEGKSYKLFESLRSYINSYEQNMSNDILFDLNGNLKDSMKYRTLEDYDLKKIDWENKRIDGIDVTKNPEVNINFDLIQKDIHGANFKGYNLNKYRLYGFNIIDTDLRDTSACIDLASCNYSYPGKMSKGTLFDESNEFYLGEQPLSSEQVEDLGIKIYRK